ncbi:hypothetical protein BH10ACT9_BH10ACT9_58150 [soil metagenome]
MTTRDDQPTVHHCPGCSRAHVLQECYPECHITTNEETPDK